MSSDSIYMVCAVTPEGISTIYAVYSNREAAEDAREAVIRGIDDYTEFISNWDSVIESVGSLDELIQVRDYPLQTDFDGDVDTLWGDDWEDFNV
jgi:hypothetical protein